MTNGVFADVVTDVLVELVAIDLDGDSQPASIKQVNRVGILVTREVPRQSCEIDGCFHFQPFTFNLSLN